MPWPSSLAGLESLVVRSTLKSARYAQPPLDLDRSRQRSRRRRGPLRHRSLPPRGGCGQRGTRRRAGGRCLVVHVTDCLARGVLELHDELAPRVARRAAAERARSGGAGPAGPRPQRRRRSTLYLRGMQLRVEAGAGGRPTRSSCRASTCDHGFAAAWAERGRLERILGKFEDPSQLLPAEPPRRCAGRWRSTPDNGAAQSLPRPARHRSRPRR